jgi:hypothetical protein
MIRILSILAVAGSLVACSESDRYGLSGFLGQTPDFASEQDGYVACLTYAMRGNHNLTAEEIRSLCEEIAGVAEEHWVYDADAEDLVVPGNEYTRCVQKEEEELKELGEERAARLAKLSCKYPNYQ